MELIYNWVIFPVAIFGIPAWWVGMSCFISRLPRLKEKIEDPSPDEFNKDIGKVILSFIIIYVLAWIGIPILMYILTNIHLSISN